MDAEIVSNTFTPSPAHQRRLRELWRSAGWPVQDVMEAELLAAGLLERREDGQGHDTLRLTDAGLRALAQGARRNRQRLAAHEALCARVAREMQRAGRIAWRGLSLRAAVSKACASAQTIGPALLEAAGGAAQEPPVEAGDAAGLRWVMAMPDVFSIRHTTVEDFVEPIVHEIKVRRADLLTDVRHTAKREAYLALASQCWYVLNAGIGGADDVPPECGVMLAHGPLGEVDGARTLALEVLRAAPKRAMRLPLSTWMALAKAQALPPLDEDVQALLGAPESMPVPPDGAA
jgi:hypothetical protein